ncbi:MAG: hypothetical protein DDT31_01240 [Syntrophomonadaceae bacterium]|nr:hypothetical protein [Bacillota bacterium]
MWARELIKMPRARSCKTTVLFSAKSAPIHKRKISSANNPMRSTTGPSAKRIYLTARAKRKPSLCLSLTPSSALKAGKRVIVKLAGMIQRRVTAS